MSRTTFGHGDAINEKSTAKYTCTFTDTAGAAIAGTAVSAITATLKAADAGTVINSRNAQSVLNVNGGAITVGGVFTLILGASDTVAVGTSAYQPRRLTLDVTYDNGRLTHVVEFFVRSLADIT